MKLSSVLFPSELSILSTFYDTTVRTYRPDDSSSDMSLISTCECTEIESCSELRLSSLTGSRLDSSPPAKRHWSSLKNATPAIKSSKYKFVVIKTATLSCRGCYYRSGDNYFVIGNASVIVSVITGDSIMAVDSKTRAIVVRAVFVAEWPYVWCGSDCFSRRGRCGCR